MKNDAIKCHQHKFYNILEIYCRLEYSNYGLTLCRIMHIKTQDSKDIVNFNARKEILETFRVLVVKSNGPVLSALNNWY